MKPFASLLTLALLPGIAFADAELPKADVAGARDPAGFGRYEGSHLVEYATKSFDAVKLPASALLAPQGEQVDAHNNALWSAKENLALEGRLTRAAYVLPENRSPLEVLRNYQQELKDKGGSVIFECAGEECGGDADAGADHGGGRTAIIDQVFPTRAVTSEAFSTGNCAVNASHADQRYFVGNLDGAAGTTHLAVLTYTLRDDLYCKALNERTIALVTTIEAKAREQKMVTVKAGELAQGLAASGRIALYGIHFDTDKAEIKPESKPQLDEIAGLLKSDTTLKLAVTGHTDNQGGAAHNMELSRHRADSVVAALLAQGIAADRLTAQGLGSNAPVASNDSDAGRARNRRVELIKQ